MFERITYLLLFIGFAVLTGIGVYFGNDTHLSWTEWIAEKGRWVLILVNLLFLVLAVRQLTVWNIYVRKDEVQLKRFLGLQQMVLHKDDFISFVIHKHQDSWWIKNPRTTIVLKLQTTKGNVTFNSSDYKSFESTTAALFSLNSEMQGKCMRQIARVKNKVGI